MKNPITKLYEERLHDKDFTMFLHCETGTRGTAKGKVGLEFKKDGGTCNHLEGLEAIAYALSHVALTLSNSPETKPLSDQVMVQAINLTLVCDRVRGIVC